MKPLTVGEFWAGMAVLAGVFGVITIGILLHWHSLMKDELRDEQARAWKWAKREAQLMALEMLRNAEINLHPTLINESDIDWGERK